MAKLKIKKLTKSLGIILSCLLLGGVILFLSVIFTFKDKVFPNTYVNGVYVGDVKKDTAESILRAQFPTPNEINLFSGSETFKVNTTEIDLNIDYTQTAQMAYDLSNSGNFFQNAITKTQLVLKPVEVPLIVSYDKNKLQESLSIIATKIGTEPVIPNVKEVGGVIVVDKGKDGIVLDTEKTESLIIRKISQGDLSETQVFLKNYDVDIDDMQAQLLHQRAQKLLGKTLELSYENTTISLTNNDLLGLLSHEQNFSDEKINEFIEKQVSGKVNREAQNSIFVVEDGKVKEFVPSKDGLAVVENELTKKLRESLMSLENGNEKMVALDIPVTTTSPKVKTADVNNLGIKDLLGSGVSHFKGSIPNRVHNVNHAATKFKGILVAPGETFSFNKILGDVSALTGYKSAYVIKDGKTVLGDGGGVCQVSTTLFRAILDAGLPIVERRAHSYRVGYYEQNSSVGLDATVYYPTTDLKFKNDTPAHLLIQSSIDLPNSTLYFEIYGTHDGRVATTTKPVITSSSAPPEDLYVDDPTLPAGKITQVEHKAFGARVVFNYKVERNGEVLIDQQFVSSYRPWQAVFLRGTGPAI